MFQQADVGERPAAPVVVPVSLVLPLQSPGAASRQGHAAAGTGADGALVFKHTDLQLRTHKSRADTHRLNFRVRRPNNPPSPSLKMKQIRV